MMYHEVTCDLSLVDRFTYEPYFTETEMELTLESGIRLFDAYMACTYTEIAFSGKLFGREIAAETCMHLLMCAARGLGV